SNPVGQGDKPLVDVTPRPMLAFLERCHQWVLFLMKMFCCMLVNRRIATAHMTASKTKAEMHPLVVVLNTFFAAVNASRLKDGCHFFVLTGNELSDLFPRSFIAVAGLKPYTSNKNEKERAKRDQGREKLTCKYEYQRDCDSCSANDQ